MGRNTLPVLAAFWAFLMWASASSELPPAVLQGWRPRPERHRSAAIPQQWDWPLPPSQMTGTRWWPPAPGSLPDTFLRGEKGKRRRREVKRAKKNGLERGVLTHEGEKSEGRELRSS